MAAKSVAAREGAKVLGEIDPHLCREQLGYWLPDALVLRVVVWEGDGGIGERNLCS